MGFFSGLSETHWVEIVFLLVCLFVTAPFFATWLAKVFNRSVSGWEMRVYRIFGIEPLEEMSWKTYLANLLVFNVLGCVLLVVILMGQSWLPLNPDAKPGLSFGMALNIAVSFITNTNWQVYAGEEVISVFSEVFGLCVQNFLSAATGLAVLVCLARSFKRKTSTTVGNFWVDLCRSSLVCLLPLSIIGSVFFISQGVPQSYEGKIKATTLENREQVLPQGPVASRLSIKMLGSNGGGIYNANSAHPYENPTPISNFVSLFLMLFLPFTCILLYGNLVGDRGHAWAMMGAVFTVFVPAVLISIAAQEGINHSIHDHLFMEGIETRFGTSSSALWQVITTATSNGSVNSQVSSMAPLVGFVNLFLMLTVEVIFGGVGSGLYGLVLFSVLTVFLAGLMVGRTPEYLGKKIHGPEIVWASIGVMASSAVVLLFAGLAAVLPYALEALKHGGPHGLSEFLYAFSSAAENNGSAFAGINAAHPFFLWTTTIAMLLGRYSVIVPVLALAGSFAMKKQTPESSGTFPTNGLPFLILLVGAIVIVGALTFLPVLSLGPIAEHFLLQGGRVFAP